MEAGNSAQGATPSIHYIPYHENLFPPAYSFTPIRTFSVSVCHFQFDAENASSSPHRNVVASVGWSFCGIKIINVNNYY